MLYLFLEVLNVFSPADSDVTVMDQDLLTINPIRDWKIFRIMFTFRLTFSIIIFRDSWCGNGNGKIEEEISNK